MRSVILPLLVLAAATLHAASTEPFFEKVVADDYSPQRDILVEHYFDRDGTDQIWLVSSADPGKRHLLYTHQRHAEVLFSDDERWLAINDHYLSNESRLLLFRRRAPLEYEQVADVSAAAWDYFARRNGLKESTGFDHSYVDAVRWADDQPPTLLLCLGGHLDSRHKTGEWYCLYDVDSKRFSTDFDAHNKKKTRFEVP